MHCNTTNFIFEAKEGFHCLYMRAGRRLVVKIKGGLNNEEIQELTSYLHLYCYTSKFIFKPNERVYCLILTAENNRHRTNEGEQSKKKTEKMQPRCIDIPLRLFETF